MKSYKYLFTLLVLGLSIVGCSDLDFQRVAYADFWVDVGDGASLSRLNHSCDIDYWSL